MLIGVVVLIRLLRRYGGRPGDSLPAHQFDVLAGRRLDGQTSIHLVRVGRRIVAVGTSPAGVQPVTVIDDPREVEELLSGGAPQRKWGAGEPAPSLFSGANAIRRGLEQPAARPSVGSSGPGPRRAAATLAEESNA